VNLNTVAKAYRALADEGLVELRHGSGARVRVAGAPYRAAAPADDERRVHELIGRWVLAGATRAAIERRLANAVERFFDKSEEVGA
jgi:DNA-binding transcriptional regulator YhcF (GntR family)